jgi:hypothetical protein
MTLARRLVAGALGVILIVLGLIDWHVQVGAIVAGVLLLSGVTLVELITLARRPPDHPPP